MTGAEPSAGRKRRRGWGEGSVYQRSDGRWAASLELGYQGDRRVRKVFYARTRRAAAQQLAAAQEALRRDGVLPDASLSVTDLVAYWRERTDARVTPRTRERRESLVRTHVLPYLGHRRALNLAPGEVERWQEELQRGGLAPATVLKARHVLSAAYRLAERHRLLPHGCNPVSDAQPPTLTPHEARSLSVEEITTFLAAIRGDQLEALYVLALVTTLRRGELLGLQWRDVDEEAGTLRVRRQVQRTKAEGLFVIERAKSRAGRRLLVLPRVALQALRAHRAAMTARTGQLPVPEAHVFATTAGTPLDPANLARAWRALRARLGLGGLKLHELRHSATSFYLALGVPPHVVQRIAGHADVSTTLGIYAHVADQDLQAAARAVDRALARRMAARTATRAAE